MLYCQSCGAEARSTYKFCPVCGEASFSGSKPGSAVTQVPATPLNPLPTRSGPQSPASSQNGASIDVSAMQYAGFWRRAGSLVLDGIFVTLLTLPIFFLFFFLIDAMENEDAAVLIFYALSISAVFIYYGVQESGEHQATWGKRIMGLVVSDMQGQRITLGRAFGRHLGRFLSMMLMYLGYVLALFTERRQTLHDKLSGTVVLYRGQ